MTDVRPAVHGRWCEPQEGLCYCRPVPPPPWWQLERERLHTRMVELAQDRDARTPQDQR